MYIILEGIDGSGKTTQAQILASKIPNALYLSEPTDGPIGREIRRRVNRDAMYPVANPKEAFAMFVADRFSRAKEIETLLAQGKTIIQDRSYWSTIVYQGNHPETFDTKEIVAIHKWMPKADLTVLLDLGETDAGSRLLAKGEMPQIATLAYLRNKYLDLAKKYKDITVMNAKQDQEAVTKQLLEAIEAKRKLSCPKGPKSE